MGHFFTRKLITSLLVGFVFAALGVGSIRLRPMAEVDGQAKPSSWAPSFPDRWERGFFDFLTAHQAAQKPVGSDIVLVTIDQAPGKADGISAADQPWSRAWVGSIVKELHELGAKLVVLDSGWPNASRIEGDDQKFAQALAGSGPVLAGFGFVDAMEGSALEAGRWAIFKGSYATRGAALLAAGPLLARGARPYLVRNSDRVEIWLGGYRDQPAAQKDVERWYGELDASIQELPPLRELMAQETVDRVSTEALFTERNAVAVQNGQDWNLKTFQTIDPPIAELAASDIQFGHLRLQRDDDDQVRSVRHLIRHEGRYYPSLALAVAMKLTGQSEVLLSRHRLVVGPLSVPIDSSGSTTLRYHGMAEKDATPESSYPLVPVAWLTRSMQRRAEGKSIDQSLIERVRHQVVLVSLARAGALERESTALSRVSLRSVVDATALDNLLRGDGIARASMDYDSVVALSMALLGALISLLLTRSTRPGLTILVEILVASLVGIIYLRWVNHQFLAGWWVTAVTPLVVFNLALFLATLVNFVDDHHAVMMVHEALGYHAPLGVVERVLSRPKYLSLEGERRSMSVLVWKLNGEAGLAEQLNPQDLVRLFNDCFTEVVEEVTMQGGQVGHIGQASIIAFWGAPLPDTQHAKKACLAAGEIKDRLASRRKYWKNKLGVDLAWSMGLNSGDLVVGNFGSAGSTQRICYTVMGEAADVASNLALTDAVHWRAEILMGEATFEVAKDIIRVREIDLVRVKSRSYPLRVMELRGLSSDVASESEKKLVAQFHQALIAFRRRQFAQAIAILEPLVAEFPGDQPSAMYLERCRAYLTKPPDNEWDGVWEKI